MKELNLAGLQNLRTAGEFHNVVVRHPHKFELLIEVVTIGYMTVSVHSYHNTDLYCQELKRMPLTTGLGEIRKAITDAFVEMEWFHKKSSIDKIQKINLEAIDIVSKFGFKKTTSNRWWSYPKNKFTDIHLWFEPHGLKIEVEENHKVIDELVIPYARYGKLLLNSKIAQALHTTEIPF